MMLKTFKRSGLVWSLVLCLVLTNGFMAAPSVAHAEHHGAHQAGTHASGICAWLCAAGQQVETASVDFESVLQMVGRTEPVLADLVTLPTSEVLFPRGPPAVSL
ncbi:MAG: hypothetical protein OEV77_05325 [Nitrospira sp.]|nr:hypothetical protein [Nitrospira sp.]